MSYSQTAELIDISTFIQPNWILSRRSIQSGGLIVEHHLEPADTVETPPISQNFLCLNLSQTLNQVTRFDRLEFNGSYCVGDVWLLPASSCSGFWSWESTDETLMFTLAPSLLDEIASTSDCANLSGLQLKPVVRQQDPTLLTIGQLFKREMTQDGIASQLYVDALALQFAIHLLRHYTTQSLTPKQHSGGLSQQQMKHLVDYMQANLERSIHLEELAALLNISQYHFCRLFKQSTGRSPYQFVIQQRVDRAKQLLRKSDRSILDVAIRCGFADGSHLTRHFRRSTGVTPAVFRQQS
jgi:AraC family transcriptional regulator